MRGENYIAVAIEGTPDQFTKILSEYDYSPDNGLGCCNGDGVWRICRGVLCIEIEGWGAEIDYAERTRDFAKSLGCRTRSLNLPMENPGPDYLFTDDAEGKYFVGRKQENGVTVWDWTPDYRPDRSGKEAAEKRDAFRKQFIEVLKPLGRKSLVITDSYLSDRDDADRPGFDWPLPGEKKERQFFASVCYQGLKFSMETVRWHEVAFKLLTPDTMKMERWLTLDAYGSCYMVFHDLEDDTYSRQPLLFEIPPEEFAKALEEVRVLIANRPKAEPRMFRFDGEVLRKILSCTVFVKAENEDDAYEKAMDALQTNTIADEDGFIVRDESDEDETHNLGDAVEVSVEEYEREKELS